MIGSMSLGLVDAMFGLVAQPGRAPGFYSARLNEKIPDGRGFKSPRARLQNFGKVLSNEGYALHTPTLRKPKSRFWQVIV